MLGEDVLQGNGGDDTLIGGAGSDLLDGGDGTDTVSFVDAPRPVSVDLNTGAAAHDGGDRLISDENVIGSSFSDQIRGDDNAERASTAARATTPSKAWAATTRSTAAPATTSRTAATAPTPAPAEHLFNCEITFRSDGASRPVLVSWPTVL